MSLINKMLRDLDARHAAPAQANMPNDVRPLPEKVRRSRFRRSLLVLALIAALAVGAWLNSAYWLPELQAQLEPERKPQAFQRLG